MIPKFYECWQEIADAALALSRVQRDELVLRRKGAGVKDPIKTAVSAAGPFILSTCALKLTSAPELVGRKPADD